MKNSGKYFTAEELKMMVELRKAGKSYAEIAYALERDVKSISMKFYKMRKENNDKLNPLFVNGVKVADVPADMVEQSTTPAKDKVAELTPRQMIKKLYDLGYRIENNHLVCYVKQVVKLSDIISD